MKTSPKILMLFLAVIFFVPLGFGQNISKNFSGNNNRPTKIDKNLLPAGFMAGLRWQKFVRQDHIEKSTHSFTYHIDTALVYSNGINPQRYIYSYDSAGNKIATCIELTTNGEWAYVSKDTATYDSVGNQLSVLSKIWKDGGWENSSLNLNTYTANHNVVSMVNKRWAGSNWVYSDSTHFSYNVNDNKVASFHAVWVDSISSWVDRNFNIYSYDSAGNLELSLYEQWNDSLWINSQMIRYTYDSTSNLIRGLVQNWGDTNWVNLYEENYTYDSVRNRLSYTGQIWNDSVWVNDQHYFYSYDAQNKLETGTGEIWNDSTWVYFEKGQYTYDVYGGIETYLYQQWKNDTVWQSVSLSQYNYDSVGNAYLGNYFSWDTTGNLSQNNDGILQIFYNYSSAVAYFTGYQVEIKYNAPLSTGVGNLKDFVVQYICTPNPAIDHATIRLGLDAKENVSLNIYSLTGKKISTLYNGMLNQGTYRFEVPVSQLSSGIYLASLLTGKYTKTIKFVVRK